MVYRRLLPTLTVALSVLGAIVCSSGLDAAAAKGASSPLMAAGALSIAGWGAPPGSIDRGVFSLALQATACAVKSGDFPSTPQTLTVIDYSKPSTTPRLWVFDLPQRALLYHELVAHGQGSGENFATSFSNDAETHSSSLGLFVADDVYVGKNGYSLRLNGLEPGVNDRARERAIVIHGAPYVSDDFVKQQGRLGRSWGCPALRVPVAHELIDRVKGGGAVFAYYPDQHWLRTSKYLDRCPVASPAAN